MIFKRDSNQRASSAALHRRFFIFIHLGLLVLLGSACTGVIPDASVARQVVMVDGEEVAVTRALGGTPRPAVTVTPHPEANSEVAVLDLSMSTMPVALDPQQARGDIQLDLIENLLVGLTRYNGEAGVVEPDLALDWEISEGGALWTFNLRDDIYWIRPGLPRPTSIIPTQSGPEPYRPVVADDVVYAVQRACDIRTQAADVLALFIIEGCEEAHRMQEPTEEALESIGVRALDEFTVQFSLTEPAAYFSTIASLPIMRPIPREVVAAYENSTASWAAFPTLMTNGRFIVSADTHTESHTELRRNPFWPTPFSGTIDIVNIYWVGSEDAYDMWQSKNIDVSPLPASRREEMLTNTRMLPRVKLIPSQAVFYLAFNFNSPLFSDPAVRRAFSAAIDRQALVETVYNGLGLPMRHFTPPGVLGAPAIDDAGVGYSPDLGLLQMAQSGVRDCKFIPEIRYLVGNTDLALHHAETLRSMWTRELGCPEEQIVIEQVHFGAVLAQTRSDAGEARPDIWDLGWTSYFPDAHNWIGDILHCESSENRQNRPCSGADNLVEQAATTLEPEARAPLYREIEQAFFGNDGEYPVAPLFVEAEYVLIHPWLIYEPARFGGEQYDRYQLDPTTKRLERQQ